MGCGGEAVTPARRGRVLASEIGDGASDLVGERVEVGVVGEGDVGLDRESQETRSFGGGRLAHPGDVTDHGGGGGDQVVDGVAVLGFDGVGVRRSLKKGGIEDVALGGHKEALHEAALPAFAGRLDQTRGLQRLEMVADLLTRHAQCLGETGCGGWLGQSREDLAAQRGQSHTGGVQVVEQGGRSSIHTATLH